MSYQEKLVNWYDDHKRDLPFRHTTDPYRIWVSEIMLQQTTVTAVIPYYERFLARFPDVASLASASLEEVYKYWEGLGYYRRAKHLFESAAIIMNSYNGHLPTTYEELISLKGVGAYTASAILAFAFHLPYSAIDGNALRVLSRLYALHDNIALEKTRRTITDIANQDIQNVDPASYNQGLMDLANAICTPTKPSCDECPLCDDCFAYQANEQNVLPVNIKKIKRQEMLYTTGIITYHDRIMMIKNKPGLLENMYGLIQYDCEGPYSFMESFTREYGSSITTVAFIKTFKHVFTHQTWHMHVYHFALSEPNDYLYTPEQLKELPIPTAHKKILDYFENNV